MASKEAQTTASAREEPEALDFSDVTTLAKARALAKQGLLVRVRLFPACSGRPDEDTGYLPPHVLEAKDCIEEQIKGLSARKDHDKLWVEAEYEDQSLVPSRIVYMRYGPGTGNMAFILEIWSPADGACVDHMAHLCINPLIRICRLAAPPPPSSLQPAPQAATGGPFGQPGVRGALRLRLARSSSIISSMQSRPLRPSSVLSSGSASKCARIVSDSATS